MNKITFNTFISLCFLGIMASAQIAKVDSTAMVTLRIDPDAARGATVSQIFEEVEFIPLETTNESLLGKISQLRATKDNFIIYDTDTKSVLIFNKKGKFMAKINAAMIKVDDNSKEAAQFYGFQMVEDKIRVSSGKYLYYFDLTGKLIEKKLAKDQKPDEPYPFLQTNHMKIIGKDSIPYEIALISQAKKDTALYFSSVLNRYKYDQFLSSGSNHDRLYNYGVADELFYLRFYDFNIYKVTPNKLSLAYRLIFPASSSLPQDFMTNPIYRNQRLIYFQKNNKVFYGLSDTYKFDNLLFLKLSSMNFDKSDKNALIYNLATSEVTSIKDLEPDSLSSYLPVTDLGAYYDFYSFGFHLYQDRNLYTSYSSLAMFTFKEQSAGKQPIYNSVLSTYFKTQTKKSNPVLIRLKPKPSK